MTPRLLAAALLLAASTSLHAETNPFDLQTLCNNDPARCDLLLEKVRVMKDYCDQNPESCNEIKQRITDKATELKAQCDADPAACEAKRAEWMERLQQQTEAQQQ